jgi:hypothetical protein
VVHTALANGCDVCWVHVFSTWAAIAASSVFACVWSLAAWCLSYIAQPRDAHDENIALYVKLLAESAQDTAARQKMLLRLLAEEKAKGKAPPAE